MPSQDVTVHVAGFELRAEMGQVKVRIEQRFTAEECALFFAGILSGRYEHFEITGLEGGMSEDEFLCAAVAMLNVAA